ncbi:MAG: hypothetical protein V5A68_03605 [Candidatus Thermoplasmatota archaeon]
MRQLFTNPEVKKFLEKSSDEDSIKAIEAICKDKNIIIKKYRLNQYYETLQLKRKNEKIQKFEKKFKDLLSKNISSAKECINLEIFNNSNITVENITSLENRWHNYLDENPYIKSSILNKGLDSGQLFFVSILFIFTYSSIFGGLSVTVETIGLWELIVMIGIGVGLSYVSVTLLAKTYPWIPNTIDLLYDIGITRNFIDSHPSINSTLKTIKNLSINRIMPFGNLLISPLRE